MRQEIFRICIGTLIILVHARCFRIIFLFKDAYLTRAQQLGTALILMSLTAGYVTAVIRSAIENKERQARAAGCREAPRLVCGAGLRGRGHF